jgi:hypothetical protein
MSNMVLMKPDGTYEEMEMTTDKIIYFQSRGYKVYTWKELFESTLEATTAKITSLEYELCEKVSCQCNSLGEALRQRSYELEKQKDLVFDLQKQVIPELQEKIKALEYALNKGIAR